MLKQLLFPGTDPELWESIPVPTTPLPQELDTGGQPDWRSALLAAIEQRPDLRQARADIDAAQVQLARARSERLAGLDLSLSANARGDANSAGDSIEQITDLDQPTYTAALTYSMPIGNRVTKHAERAASIALRQARLTYDATEAQVAGLVRQAVRDVQYQAEAVRAALQSRELARQQLAAERARYEEGLSTNYQVLEFQQALAQTQSSERAARVAFAKALVNMEYVQGYLGEQPTP
jgi:outer membrane protein TolC